MLTGNKFLDWCFLAATLYAFYVLIVKIGWQWLIRSKANILWHHVIALSMTFLAPIIANNYPNAIVEWAMGLICLVTISGAIARSIWLRVRHVFVYKPSVNSER